MEGPIKYERQAHGCDEVRYGLSGCWDRPLKKKRQHPA